MCYNLSDARTIQREHLRKEDMMTGQAKEMLDLVMQLTDSEKDALYELLLTLIQNPLPAETQQEKETPQV